MLARLLSTGISKTVKTPISSLKINDVFKGFQVSMDHKLDANYDVYLRRKKCANDDDKESITYDLGLNNFNVWTEHPTEILDGKLKKIWTDTGIYHNTLMKLITNNHEKYTIGCELTHEMFDNMFSIYDTVNGINRLYKITKISPKENGYWLKVNIISCHEISLNESFHKIHLKNTTKGFPLGNSYLHRITDELIYYNGKTLFNKYSKEITEVDVVTTRGD
jgi:hypothetical protein